MDVIIKLQNRLECKINYTLLALLPNKINTTKQWPAGGYKEQKSNTHFSNNPRSSSYRRNDDKRDKCIS